MRSALAILIAGLSFVMPAQAQENELMPLTSLPGDPIVTIRDTVVVTEPSGARRLAGNLLIVSDADFNTGALRAASPNIALISEGAPDAFGLRIIVARVPEPEIRVAMAVIIALPGVRTVDPDYLIDMATSDPYWPAQQADGLAMMNLPQAWAIGTGHSGVRVAVVDSGVNPTVELADSLITGRSFFSDPSDTSDSTGHGTLVASVIAARPNNGIGIAGVAHGVKIVPVKACDAFYLPDFTSCGSATILASAFQWVAGQVAEGEIHIVNMSFGGETDPVAGIDVYLEAIAEFGGTLVGAAGNSGESELDWPGRNEHVIGVGGTTNTGTRHPSSDYGDELDVAAPYSTFSMDNEGTVMAVSGTSFAAPAIAGLLALAKGSNLQEMYHNDVWTSHNGIAGTTRLGMAYLTRMSTSGIERAPSGTSPVIFGST
jgi:subtilisin family serine protease